MTILKAAPRKLFPVKTRGANRESRLATAVGLNVAKAVAEALDRVADDGYNAAILNNPTAFATTQGRDPAVSMPSEAPVLVYRNDDHGEIPVVLSVRVDGQDVSEILGSNASFNGTEAQIRGVNQITAVLRPRQELWVAVRALNYPVRVIPTAIPLRGKAAVFGG